MYVSSVFGIMHSDVTLVTPVHFSNWAAAKLNLGETEQ